MTDHPHKAIPEQLPDLLEKGRKFRFDMSADLKIGSLLRTLIASKPCSNNLELGTGIGASLCWMVEGLQGESTITTIDNDPHLVQLARDFFGEDPRVKINCVTGEQWISNYQGPKFDLIFADAWPGKYTQLEEVLDLLAPGGFYIVDDLSAHPNWPSGHQQQVAELMKLLENRTDFVLTKLNWSTGIIIGVKL